MWKETTYRERCSALMDLCPENGMIQYNESAVIKLASFIDRNEWRLNIKKIKNAEDVGRCEVNTSTKTVKVNVPRIFYSAAILVAYDRVFYPLISKRQTTHEKFYQFPGVNAVSETSINGFILIHLSENRF